MILQILFTKIEKYQLRASATLAKRGKIKIKIKGKSYYH